MMPGPVDLEKTTPIGPEPPAPVEPAPRPATLRRRARAAIARSAARDRSLTTLIGLILLAAGVLVALLSYGVFGAGRAGRPLLDPVIVDALRAQPLVARVVAVVVGVLLLVLGLVWAARSLRPERRPDVVLDGGQDTAIVVSSHAVAEAVGSQAQGLAGVGRARARMVGGDTAPALRITLWLADDADVRDVLDRLNDEVLGPARDSLGLAALPVAVRLELDSGSAPPRVA
ncbi:alkaline shock response membrane anchor protein AmaP [Pseudonocardia nigra]|uniref:alkaline shock response membrane anchor protein AmaP n=1 Tax=Pseudonocardia nigra TaxID=1921578 RepID=UPI001FE959CF|nr:alkaline shock response membrane anchor protein AmaP [Pseudonocardia nigra]